MRPLPTCIRQVKLLDTQARAGQVADAVVAVAREEGAAALVIAREVEGDEGDEGGEGGGGGDGGQQQVRAAVGGGVGWIYDAAW
jgi:hypothetical protein